MLHIVCSNSICDIIINLNIINNLGLEIGKNANNYNLRVTNTQLLYLKINNLHFLCNI